MAGLTCLDGPHLNASLADTHAGVPVNATDGYEIGGIAYVNSFGNETTGSPGGGRSNSVRSVMKGALAPRRLHSHLCHGWVDAGPIHPVRLCTLGVRTLGMRVCV